MKFKSFEDLSQDVADWSSSLPQDVSLIVGVPRSGLLPATLLALHRNIPVLDLEGFLAGRNPEGGLRFEQRSIGEGAGTERVLLIDDSAYTGRQLREVRDRIADAGLSARVETAVPYVSAESKGLVDHYYEVLEPPRIFEWNLYHHDLLAESCLDLDGVLCRDPTDSENDDGPNYKRFISSVPPRVVPSVHIGHIVSARTEEYRESTELWLESAGIRYGQLHLYEGTAAERRRRQDHAEYKARVYRKVRARLFVESDDDQARKISAMTGRPVISVLAARLYSAGVSYTVATSARHRLQRFRRTFEMFRRSH